MDKEIEKEKLEQVLEEILNTLEYISFMHRHGHNHPKAAYECFQNMIQLIKGVIETEGRDELP